jgi:hypothetical protein
MDSGGLSASRTPRARSHRIGSGAATIDVITSVDLVECSPSALGHCCLLIGY